MTDILPPMWSKNGGAAQALPEFDVDEDGFIVGDLHRSADRRAQLGWVAVSCPPKISRMQAQLELEARGQWASVNADILASGNNNLVIYWTTASDFERYHDQVLLFAGLLGYDALAADAFFIAAAERR